MNDLASLSRPALEALRRNNFFYGKLLDEMHLRMEQDYFNSKRWMLNRLALGRGVLCGLQVTSRDGQLRVSPGVAIDGWGREVIVPAEVAIDPWIVTEDDGTTRELPRDSDVPVAVHLVLFYRECRADFQPAFVDDCKPEPNCVAGTIVERFALRVLEGEAPAIHSGPSDALCGALYADADAATRREQLCLLTQNVGRGQPPADPGIVLARFDLEKGGQIGPEYPYKAGLKDPYKPREVLYSNEMLFDLLLCARSGANTGPQGPPGKGLDPDDPELTRVSRINWIHNQRRTFEEFELGLDIFFTQAVVEATRPRPIEPEAATGREWFIVSIEVPRRIADDVIDGVIDVHRVLEASIEISGDRASFVPHPNFRAKYSDILTTNRADQALVRVVLKCDFLLNTRDQRPVDGDPRVVNLFLNGSLDPITNLPQTASPLSGDGVPGGDFESWFFLAPPSD